MPGGRPGLWHELSTRDYDAALPFYAAVFGWEPQVLSDTPEFRYSTIGPEGAPVAGVLDSTSFLPEGVPSHWAVYFGVPDAATAAARVTELGGAALREPWDSEFGTFARSQTRRARCSTSVRSSRLRKGEPLPRPPLTTPPWRTPLS